MLTGMNPRKRRWLATLAVVVVTGILGVFVVRMNPEEDLPRLVLLRQEWQEGQRAVVFRFDAPKHQAAMLRNIRTHNLNTGMETRAQDTWDGGVVLSGKAIQIRVMAPSDDVWRLRCDASLQGSGLKGVVSRAKFCWRAKSFPPFNWIVRPQFLGPLTVQSELITKAVPPVAEAPLPD